MEDLLNPENVKIAHNQIPETDIFEAFPEGFTISSLDSMDERRHELQLYTGIHPFLDYVAAILVFATGLGLKKFFEAFASESGKKLAKILFNPIQKKERTQKMAEFAKKMRVKKSEVKYDLTYKIVLCIESENTRKSILLHASGEKSKSLLDSPEAFRKAVLAELNKFDSTKQSAKKWGQIKFYKSPGKK